MKHAFGLDRLFSGKLGLEIGGPSPIFIEDLPIYQLADGIDGANFSAINTWTRQTERYRYYEEKAGDFFVAEASSLPDNMSNAYDFVLASHCLEHCANAIKAMKEWRRVIRQGGLLLVIVPDKRHTFDHRRATTTFEHLLKDYAKDVGEDDLSHMDEILRDHDIAMDPGSGTPEYFRERSLKNFDNRCFHHHVFDLSLIEEVFSLLDMPLLLTASTPPHHIISIGMKS